MMNFTPYIDRVGIFVIVPDNPFTVTSNILNTTSTGVSSSDNATRVIATSKLCDLPAFCSSKAYDACANTTLRACAECSQTGMGFFALFVISLGLACVLGNVLVMAVLKKLGLGEGFNKMKFSLAIADLLTGIQLLVVAVYNFSWSINVTSLELDRRQLSLRGSTEATVGGIFLFFTFTSSLYHLVFMGAQRLYAIKWPLWFRMQKEIHVVIGLVAVWVLALLASTVPGWFPSTLTYTYMHTVFLFYFNQQMIQTASGYYPALIAMVVTFYVLPYLIMTITSVATMLVVRSNLKMSTDIVSSTNKSKKVDHKEVQIFVTVFFMQLGFTVTLVPLVVVNALFFGHSLNCSNIALPYLVCFYLSMSNSLVNVVVYSFRDKSFKKAAIELLKIKKKRKPTDSSGPSKPTTNSNSQTLK